MCGNRDDCFGVILACAWCSQPIALCEQCYASKRQHFCADACRFARRRAQVFRAFLRYMGSQKGKVTRSRVNESYRRRRANKLATIEIDQDSTHGSNGEIHPCDIAQAPPGLAVRALESPCHEVHITALTRSRSEASRVDEQPTGRLPADTSRQSSPLPSDAKRAQSVVAVRPPSLGHCLICGAVVRWVVDEARIRQRALARRKAAASQHKRIPRHPVGPSWSG